MTKWASAFLLWLSALSRVEDRAARKVLLGECFDAPLAVCQASSLLALRAVQFMSPLVWHDVQW